MKCGVALLGALLYASLATGQVVIKLNDGVAPPEDGDTQLNSAVVITCEITTTTLVRGDDAWIHFRVNKDAEWEEVALSRVLLNRWDSPTDNYTITVVTIGDMETVTFTILAAAMVDAGTYKCLVKNGDTVKEDAEKPIQIYAQTEEVRIEGQTNGIMKVTADEPTLIKCTAINGSLPQMSLKIDGQDIEGLSDMRVTEEFDGVYVAQEPVTFQSELDGKQLTCSARVKTFTNTMDAHTTLQITAKPTIECEPLEQAVAVGSEAKFTCLVSGIPLSRPEQISWSSLGGNTLKGDEDNQNAGLKSETSITADGKKLRVVLTVTVMSINSPETFTIAATNDGGGSARKMVELKEPGPNPAPDGDPNGAATQSLSVGLSILLVVATTLLL